MKSTIETFNDTIEGKKPDRILSYDVIMNKKLFETFGGKEGDIYEQNAKMLKAIGLDCTRLIFDPSEHWLHGKIACWEKYLGVPKGFEVKERGGTSWISKRPFNDIEGLKRCLPKMPRIEEVAEWYVPYIRRTKQVCDENDLVFVGETEGPLTDAFGYIDLEFFCFLIYDEPDIVDYILDVTTEWARIIVELYCQFPSSNVFLLGEDIAYKTSTIFPVSFMEDKIFPRWEKIVQPLKDAKIKFLYHSDGNLNNILDTLVNDVGIEGLNPIEPKADMDIFGIREKYPELILLGNVDSAGALISDDPKDVEKAVKELIDRIGGKGRLLAGSSTEIGDAIPIQNILMLYSSIRKYGSQI